MHLEIYEAPNTPSAHRLAKSQLPTRKTQIVIIGIIKYYWLCLINFISSYFISLFTIIIHITFYMTFTQTFKLLKHVYEDNYLFRTQLYGWFCPLKCLWMASKMPIFDAIQRWLVVNENYPESNRSKTSITDNTIKKLRLMSGLEYHYKILFGYFGTSFKFNFASVMHHVKTPSIIRKSWILGVLEVF